MLEIVCNQVHVLFTTAEAVCDRSARDADWTSLQLKGTMWTAWRALRSAMTARASLLTGI